MPLCACTGGILKCTFGIAPSPITVLPITGASTNTPAGNIMEFKPMANVKPFGQCISPQHPIVKATKKPAPCQPIVTGPWMPGATKVKFRGPPALSQPSMAKCAYNGIITVIFPGQVKVQVT